MTSIIVIGNGPSVLNNKYGPIIDTFDEVYRINHYRPNKAHVGTKITNYFTSTYKTTFYPDVVKMAKEILVLDEINIKRSPYDKYKQTSYIKKFTIKPFLHKFNFKDFPNNGRASTGLWLLTYLIYIKKYTKIVIYGFDNLVPGQKMHYFENIITSKTNHPPMLERRFINYHIRRGILIRLEDYIKQKNETIKPHNS